MESMDSRSHEVFISYSSKNKNVADAIVADLEQHGIRCWYAPRDVLPGEVWTSEINKAIRETTVFILIYTEDSNKSQQVTNEVTLAVSNGKTIIPFRLTKAGMNDTLGYYLSSLHWLDAVDPPLGRNIEILREKVTSILAIEKEAARAEAAQAEGTAAGQAAGAPAGELNGGSSSTGGSYGGSNSTGGSSGDGDKPKTLGAGILIGILAAAVVCIGGMFFLKGGKSDTGQKADSGSVVAEQAEAQQEVQQAEEQQAEAQQEAQQEKKAPPFFPGAPRSRTQLSSKVPRRRRTQRSRKPQRSKKSPSNRPKPRSNRAKPPSRRRPNRNLLKRKKKTRS